MFISTLIVWLSFSSLNLAYGQSSHIEKLPISIYYESLCPDSVKFIERQLYPTWKSLRQYLDITFIPFGKSMSINQGEKFVCQHGPDECTGNKLQSCALEILPNQDLKMEFVRCAMAKDAVIPQCCLQFGIWNQVYQCFNSTIGTQLQLDAEYQTAMVRPKFVPTVIFNYHFIQEEQDTAQTNLIGVVCSYLQQIYTGLC